MKQQLGIMFFVVAIILVVFGLTYAWCEWSNLESLNSNLINNVL